MDHNPDSGCKIKDTFCASIMVNMQSELVKGKTSDEAFATENDSEPDGDVNHGKKSIK